MFKVDLGSNGHSHIGSSEKRLAALPDTPTIGEGPGLGGFVSGSWQGMLAPAKTPPEMIEKVNAEMARVTLQFLDHVERPHSPQTKNAMVLNRSRGQVTGHENVRARTGDLRG